MKKSSLLLIALIIAIFGWSNIKNKTDVIQLENFPIKKKIQKLNLDKELAVNANPQETLKTSLSSISSQNSEVASEQKSLLSQSSLSLSSLSTFSTLPVNSLDLKIEKINQFSKSAMEKYLIDSANLNFPDNTDVSLALFEARDGNPSKMNNLIKLFKEKIPKLEKLTPPDELKEFHEKSLISIKNYVSQLEKIAQFSGNREKILEVLNSQEMNTARNTARELLTNLREIVKKYNLSIPTEVLPKDKIPDQKP